MGLGSSFLLWLVQGTDLAEAGVMGARVNRQKKFEAEAIGRRGSKESGFWYVLPDGSRVTDERLLERIDGLVIPPAWKEVRIAPSDRWALQALGVDSKGRTQYLYHERFRRRREREKYIRIIRFAELLPKLRRRVGRDLDPSSLEKTSVMAAALRLIDQGFFRLGNERSAEEEIYGLTTILPEHVTIIDDVVELEYVGKWGKKQQRAVRDEKVARLVESLIEAGEGELFKFESRGRLVDVKDRHVNEYIQSIIGEGFSAKDFRTWAGSVIFATALGLMEEADSEAARRRRVTKAIKSTSEMLGNTPAVCRSSYVCPVIVDAYLEGHSFASMGRPWSRKVVARTRLSLQEKALIEFLRETISVT